MFKSKPNFHRSYLQLTLVISTFAVLLAHALGIFLDFYVKFQSYDSLVHFVGGFWVAIIGFWVLKNPSFRETVFFVFLIGIIWEFFEFTVGQISIYLYDIPINLQPSLGDSVLDIIFDVLGSLAAIFYSRSIKDSMN
ncbi:MAG: hypothetical protein AAB617_02890 [Patescibacteria group bacterium]